MGLAEILLNPDTQEHFDLFLMVDLLDRNDPRAYSYFCRFRHELLEELSAIRQLLSHPQLSGVNAMLEEICSLRDQIAEYEKREVAEKARPKKRTAKRSPSDRLRVVWESRSQ